MLHPEDRAAVVREWWDASQLSGEVCELTVRSRGRGGWRSIVLRFLNLLHQPGVRAVLIGLTDRGAIDVRPVVDTEDRFESPAWVFQEIDSVGTILRTEGDSLAVFGAEPTVLEGRNMLDVLHPEDHDAAMAMWVDLIAAPGATRVIRQRAMRPDGSELWIESTVTNRLEGTVGAVVGVSLDISDRLAQDQAIRASQEEFRTLAEEVPTAVFRATADGRVTFGNGRWFNLTSGVGVVEFLIDLVAVERRAEWRERWADFVDGGISDTLKLEYPTPDHRTVLSVHCRRVQSPGSDARFVGVLSDVTDTAELRHRADHDSLTGLLNREAFDRRVAALLASDESAVLAFVDLDGFKEINDALGHEAGDHVLTEVARRLTACVRPGDDVGRYGGDEFVVLCSGVPDTTEDGLCKRITHALTPPVVCADSEWPLHASIGTARPRPGDGVTDLVRRADHAMYEDKRRRRTRRRSGWWTGG